MIRKIADLTLSATLIVSAFLIALATIHDIQHPSEDMMVVWACDVMGDHKCPPNESHVYITPSNLLNW